MSGQIIDDVVSELISNVLHTSFDSLGESTVKRARKHVIDVVGCMIGGARAPGCSMLLDLLREWGGAGEATVLGYGLKVPSHEAAMMNSVLARSYDFESCGTYAHGKSTPGHISGSTVPTALAVAELMGLSGREFLTALVLGDDLAARIATASKLDLDSGFDPSGTVNVFGTTAIAGRLLGLTEPQLRNAFGIALNQLGGSFQNIFDGALSFKLPQGLAARAGIFSAALAKKGYTGATDPLLGPYGYFALYCRTHQVEHLTTELGRKFFAGNTFKAYPCCRSNHAAIDCVLDLSRTYSFDVEDVDEVVVDVAPIARAFAVGKPFKPGEFPQVSAAFNLQYTVATALLRKAVRLEHFTDVHIRDPGIAEMITRIRLTDHISPDKPLAACVRLKMKDGKEYVASVDTPKGNEISTPMTSAEIQDKFLQNVAFSKQLPPANAERALALLERLETIDNVNTIVNLLADRARHESMKTPEKHGDSAFETHL